jgi:hypothetical protein
VIAFNLGGIGLDDGDHACLVLSCCDIHGNEGGDWVGYIADQNGVRGNFCADPLFCGAVDGSTPTINAGASPHSLHANSPCLPGNHPYGYECGLIGAHGQGCGIAFLEQVAVPQSMDGAAGVETVATETTTWGRIKWGYRR